MLAELNGFVLETASNGEEALSKLANLDKDPSVVFVDLNMPIMTGSEFLREVRDRGLAPSSHIVILSASDKASLQNLDCGRSLTWLPKPFELAEVIKTIKVPRLH